MVIGQSFTWGAIVKFLTLTSVGSVGIGLAFGIASDFWLGFIFNDTLIDLSLTLAVSYIAYFIAQEGADVSGVLAVMTLGMFFSAVSRTAFKAGGPRSLHHFWEVIAYIANTLIFILSGVIIAEGVLQSDKLFENHGNSWGYLFLLYVFVQVSRIIVVVILYPFLRYFGYGLDWKEAIILVWSGLQGAVALSLSLSVKRASDDSYYLSPETGTLFLFFAGGTVFLTLIVNGSTAQFLLNLFSMDELSSTEKSILEHTKFKMMKKLQETYANLGDSELGPVDWPTVRCLINLEWERVHPHNLSTSTSDNVAVLMSLEAMRVRLLMAARAAYSRMLDEGRITQTTAIVLIQSVDEAIDLVSQEPLCDWKGLKAHVNFPNCYKFFQTSICPQKLVRYFTVERLQSAFYICAAFLHAHRTARGKLLHFIGNSEITSIVISESEAEEEEARKFLEDVSATFPQILRIVKTRQVTYSMLKFLSDYFQNLEKDGLLEEKVVLHLHDLVQTDLKKLLQNPPLVNTLKIMDVINHHPFLGTLPSIVSEVLEGSMKEIMKPNGVTLYREGSKPNSFWLIENGLVMVIKDYDMCEGKSLKDNHSLHPTFPQGSIVGLCEVLSGKPYICNMITDSVVLCYFVETKKFLSVIRSSPGVENLLWQESVIVIAKLLLPQVFEKMSIQELRTLFAERSKMDTDVEGKTKEIPNHSIGYLLEGCLRGLDVLELISSPAALLPPYWDWSFWSPETSGPTASSFCHFGSQYKVEKKARIVWVDISELGG